MLTARFSGVRDWFWDVPWAGAAYEVSYSARVTVWVRWLVTFLCVVLLVYRPTHLPMSTYTGFITLLLVLIVFNVSIHYRIMTGREVTWRWMMALQAIDVALVTAANAVSGGMTYYFFHMLYYPLLAFFAVLFTSFRLNLVWVTVVAAVYTVMCITVGDGIDIEAREDKTLIARIVMMYSVVILVNLVVRYERIGRWRAVERERTLQRERIELSQAVHDTSAQSAYMLGLGIDSARNLAGDSNRELAETLTAASTLSKSLMWELRRPIDAGRILEGVELGEVLRAHTETFMRVTSVPTEMVQTGAEPGLTEETRSRLFSIANNALTNAFRHADASRVEVSLEFERDLIRLSISDDGAGLPEDHRSHGRGFRGMREDAERMGGELLVESSPGEGTTVTCVIPSDQRGG